MQTDVSCGPPIVKMLVGSNNVTIVHGYWMALAKVQSAISEIALSLRVQGINVRFSIHPVGGRLPGHINGEMIAFWLCLFLNLLCSDP